MTALLISKNYSMNKGGIEVSETSIHLMLNSKFYGEQKHKIGKENGKIEN